MLSLTRTSAIVIPSCYKDSYFYSQIKDHLTRICYNYQTNEKEILRFYIETERELVIPRFFPLSSYYNEPFEIIDKVNEGQYINIKHNIEFRDELQEECNSWFMSNNSGILKAGTGSGKSIMAIRMICERNRKALIFTYKVNLLDQWKQMILGFTDVKENDISILKSDNYEEDLTKKIVLVTNQTFISLLKRKGMQFVKQIRKSDFGILIGDEVHTSIGAHTFGICSLYVPCKYTYGLTATPYRYDQNHDILGYHLGEIFVPVNSPSIMVPDVKVIRFNHNIAFGKTKNYIYWGDVWNRGRYIKMARKSKIFMHVLEKLLKKSYEQDRKCLLMFPRINLLELLKESLQKDIPKEEIGMFIGSSDLSECNKRIVLSTPGKCRDGIDIPDFDLLILAFPVGNLEQACGRILRIKEGKKTPVIIDLVDLQCEELKQRFLTRKTFYEEKQWNIEIQDL